MTGASKPVDCVVGASGNVDTETSTGFMLNSLLSYTFIGLTTGADLGLLSPPESPIILDILSFKLSHVLLVWVGLLVFFLLYCLEPKPVVLGLLTVGLEAPRDLPYCA